MQTRFGSYIAGALCALAPEMASAQAGSLGKPVATPAPDVPFSAPVSTQPLPDELTRARLIWSTMIAVQQADESGNYSVLRDIAAPSFQIMNDPSRLSQLFAGIRSTYIDLSDTLFLSPKYAQSPSIDRQGRLHLIGAFGLRPTAILFDFTYEWVSNRWKLFGVSLGAQSLPSGLAPPSPPKK
jgi:hypothetical protein